MKPCCLDPKQQRGQVVDAEKLSLKHDLAHYLIRVDVEFVCDGCQRQYKSHYFKKFKIELVAEDVKGVE